MSAVLGVQRHESNLMRRSDLAPVSHDLGRSGPFTVTRDELSCVESLTVPDECRRCPRQLPPVVGADRLRGSILGGAVKQQDDSRDFVKLDEIRAFLSQLLRAEEIPSTRRQRPTAARHVEAIEVRELELVRQECVRGLLQSPIRAGDDKSMRSLRFPDL